MIVALAGRRVDPPHPKQIRFPAESVPQVSERITHELKKTFAEVLVCSAACGADLLALEAALALGIACEIVLPFSVERFRQSSVVDRPGDWGERFDRVLTSDGVQQVQDLGLSEDNASAYLTTNIAILERAMELSNEHAQPRLALVVWNGQARDEQDVTLAFRQEAEARGFQIEEILTV